MSLKSHFQLMSQYNQWMNKSIYQAASKLSIEKIKADQGAFFKSILGTLNHILVADLIWLKRFAEYPKQYQSLNYVKELTNPTSLDQILEADFSILQQKRQELDQIIINWCEEIEFVLNIFRPIFSPKKGFLYSFDRCSFTIQT